MVNQIFHSKVARPVGLCIRSMRRMISHCLLWKPFGQFGPNQMLFHDST